MCKGGSNSQSTQQTSLPGYLDSAYQNLVGQAQNVASTPYQAYTGPRVAGFSPMQEQAFENINAATGAAQPYINQSAQYTQQGAAPVTPMQFSASAVNQYMDPYRQQVIDTTMANINRQNQIDQNNLMGGIISQGYNPFGGDRAGIAAAELSRNQDLAKNQTIAQLESQGYGQALGQFNTQQAADLQAQLASRQLAGQAGSQYAGLGQLSQQTGLAGAGAQLSAGGLQQALSQQQLDVPYQQFLEQRQYPFNTTGWLGNLLTGTGSTAGGTTTTTQPGPSTLSQVAGLGLTGLSLIGSTGGFGSSGWLTGTSGLGSQIGSWFKKGGRVKPKMAGLEGLPGISKAPTRFWGGSMMDMEPDDEGTYKVAGFADGGSVLPFNNAMAARSTGLGGDVPTASAGGFLTSPWYALMAAGLGTLASSSPFPGVAVGQGGLAGLNAYGQGQQIASESAYRNAIAEKTKTENEYQRLLLKARQDWMSANNALASDNSDSSGLGDSVAQVGANVANAQTLASSATADYDALMRKSEYAYYGGMDKLGDLYKTQAENTPGFLVTKALSDKGYVRDPQSGVWMNSQGVPAAEAEIEAAKANAEAQIKLRFAGPTAAATAAATYPYDIGKSLASRAATPVAVGPGQVVTTGLQTMTPEQTAMITNPAGGGIPVPSAALPIAVPQPAQPTQVPSPVTPMPQVTPGGTGAPQPAQQTAPPSAPAAQPSPQPSQGQLPAQPPYATTDAFTPGLTRDAAGNLVNAMTPAGQEAATGFNKTLIDTEQPKFQAAVAQQGSLNYIDHAIEELNKAGGVFTMGPGANWRIGIANNYNTMLDMIDPPDAQGKATIARFNPGAMASWTDFNKETTRLGFELARTLGSREAMMIVQQATASVPNAENTYLGARLVSSALRQGAQREIDQYTYTVDWLRDPSHRGNVVGADIEFNKTHPVQAYTDRAIAIAQTPRPDIEYLRAHPDQAAAFDKVHGKGMADYFLSGGQ